MTHSSRPTLTPSAQLKVSHHHLPAFNNFPNTSIQGKPLLIYHAAFQESSVLQIESHLKSIGVVTPSWRYTMYSTSHFHSNTHEVLTISAGSARLCFGGESSPGRVEPVVETGDVVVVPAGGAHRLLEDRGGFCMVGSYPVGNSWDMCYGRAGEASMFNLIENCGWFDKDPIYGDEGPAPDA